jgi:osmotically-inducible protein OsmY
MKQYHPMTILMTAVVNIFATGSLMATPMGDRIESSAKKSYVFKTYLKGDEIKIQTSNDSVVTLTGMVAEWSHRSLAEETVASFKGVKHVDNKLEVTGGQPAETSDIWIGMKVKFVLMFNRNVNGFDTKIDVADGVVTLRGIATSEAQKDLATEYTKDVGGVLEVKNEMTIEKPAKTTVEKVSDVIDDASITAQVKIALLFHRSTSVLSTKVETKNGIVTVSGVVKNAAEKDLVGKLVNNIKGVKGLKNEIKIGKID